MADMFAPLVAQLKANPKTIVFTEGNDPRILEAASKLLAEGVLKVVMVGNEAECKAAAAGNFDISVHGAGAPPLPARQIRYRIISSASR